MKWKCAGRVGLTVIVAPLAVTVLSAVFLRPLVARPGENPRSACQENLKNLTKALQLYIGDYDAVLPSSILQMTKPTWDAEWSPEDFSSFASERGVLPPPREPGAATWPMVLHPYLACLATSEAIWCPADRSASDEPTSIVSYYWKAAVDRAWFEGYRKEGDYGFPSQQVILYERSGWHSGGRSRGLTDGVRINCAYLDGHAAQVEIRDSGYSVAEDPAEPLPKSGVGEPAWFNYSYGDSTPEFNGGQNWDPQVWGDNLVEVQLPQPQPRHKAISDCQTNLKNLGIAVLMYVNDWDSELPSSALYGGSTTWNTDDFVQFASKRGELRTYTGGYGGTWATVLYPYMKHERSIWCPADDSASDDPKAIVSYYWKAAVDAAWFGGPSGKGPICRKESDFKFPSDQIVLYERCSWHGGGRNRGLVDGVTINCAFLDAHVAAKKIRDSGHTAEQGPSGPLPESGVGEPAWFNYSFGEATPQFSRGSNWNPMVWGDNLP